MKKSAYYSDLFFTFSLTAFVALFLFRFFGAKLSIALAPSLSLGAVFATLLSFKLKKKQKVFALKKSEELEKDSLFLYLRLAKNSEIHAFFEPRLTLFTCKLQERQVQTDEAQPNPSEVLFCDNFCFFPCFSFRELTADDIAETAKNLRGIANPVILCDKLSEQARDLCDKLSFSVIQGDELYRKLKDEGELPQNLPLNFPAPKTTRRRICFAKTNSKRFFKSGVLLSVCSFFTPYSVYYAVTACLFFLISILVRIYGYR